MVAAATVVVSEEVTAVDTAVAFMAEPVAVFMAPLPHPPCTIGVAGDGCVTVAAALGRSCPRLLRFCF